MLPLDIFLQIVNLFQNRIAQLEASLASALSDDAADELAIADADQRAKEAADKLVELQAMYDEYKTTDQTEDTQLLDVMNTILADLTGSTPTT
jgi:hypothetical protein